MNFWQAQIEACKYLGLVGYNFRMQDRIPVFQLMVNLRHSEGEEYDLVRYWLDWIVQLKIAGEEPPHDGKVYSE